MADKPKDDDKNPPSGDPPKDDGDPEAAFWDKLDQHISASVTSAVETKLKEMLPKKDPSGQRGKGRTTLPSIVADLMGGPFSRD